MTKTDLTLAIKDQARALGFDLIGIAPATPSATGDAYADWLRQGCAGEMAYLSRPDAVAKRRDPRLILPTVRSVVVVGMNYYTEVPKVPKVPKVTDHGSRITDHGSPLGTVSRYAWGDDYHEVMGARLEELAKFMREAAEQAEDGSLAGGLVGSCQSSQQTSKPANQQTSKPLAANQPTEKVYVDTGPLLEREVAARAGLGWVGKNTNLLNKEWGSWFFLGEVLTSLELDYDQPATAHCGTCTRCLTACPTGAFIAPYVLDARRCISYLTIELKGPIPRDLRPLIGNLIFGCDICQDVCPWNIKHARPTGVPKVPKVPKVPEARDHGSRITDHGSPPEPAFQPRPGLDAPELIPLLKLTPEEFNEKFRSSPIRRAGRRGLRRNVAVALGNSGDPAAIPTLCEALHDPDPLIRGHAAWALGRLGGKEARLALEEALEVEEDEWVREEIEEALRGH